MNYTLETRAYNFFNPPTHITVADRWLSGAETTALQLCSSTGQMWFSEIDNECGRQCWQAVQTSLCGGIPADLTFLLLFWSSKKVEEVRGFTGHEHYPYFQIINMNGRLYDPVIARFFSPDKYVANSTFTQDFNRYSYARNNPLMYTDPDGELLWFAPLIAIAVSAAISATSHVIQVACSPGGFQNWNTMNFIASTFMGAWSGAATAGIGGVIGGVSLSTGMNVLKEFGRAGAHAAVGGLTSMASGGKFWTGAATGAISSFTGSLTHNLPIAAQIGVSTLTGGITSKISGGTFWQGAVTGFTISAFNHAMDGWLTYRLYRKPKNYTTWDLNGDGKLSKYEADMWWLYGNGEPITVDGNLIDLKGFNINNTTYNSKIDGFAYGTIDAFIDLPWETAATYGGSTFKMVDGVPQMQSQGYHYNMQQNVPLRNAATWIGKPPIMRGVTPIDYFITIKY